MSSEVKRNANQTYTPTKSKMITKVFAGEYYLLAMFDPPDYPYKLNDNNKPPPRRGVFEERKLGGRHE